MPVHHALELLATASSQTRRADACTQKSNRLHLLNFALAENLVSAPFALMPSRQSAQSFSGVRRVISGLLKPLWHVPRKEESREKCLSSR